MQLDLTVSPLSQSVGSISSPRRLRFGSLEAVLFTAALSATLPVAAQEYGRATDLGTLGGPSSEASALNDEGSIVGEARNGNPASRIREIRATYHGFVKPPGSGLINIDPDSVHSRPVAINADGVIAAALGTSNGQISGSVYWRQGQGQTQLSAPSGYQRPAAVDLDDDGNILVNSNDEDGSDTPFVYNIGRRSWTRVPCPGTEQCAVSASNENGEIVGYLGVTEGPLYWSSATRSPERLRVPAGIDAVSPTDINDRGTIVATARDADGRSVVVVWSGPGRSPRVLGEGNAYAINNQDVVAGSHAFINGFGDEEQLPQLWDLRNGDRATELRGVDGERVSGAATDINNRGVVVGTLNVDDTTRAVVWSAGRTTSNRPSGGTSSSGPSVVRTTRD